MLETQFFILILIFSIPNSFCVFESGRDPNVCTNPQGIAGKCINIRQCQPLMSVFERPPLAPETAQFLQASRCGFEGKDPKVCCVSSPSTNNNGSVNPSSALLPEACGSFESTKIDIAPKTEYHYFPWLTLLEYQKPNGEITTACSGALISKRYVLTAAHCILSEDRPTSWVLIGVRLGEYNTETDPDCMEDYEGSQYCNDPVVRVGLHRVLAHENYRALSQNPANDIALLRLSREVTFTKYISPLCLPQSTELPMFLTIAGWGKFGTTSSSNTKLEFSVQLTNSSECETRYGNAASNLAGTQLCTAGTRSKDSCRGDSGGPLMGTVSDKTSVFGILSFGPSPCSTQGWPTVYTKVSEYTDWIIRNMKA